MPLHLPSPTKLFSLPSPKVKREVDAAIERNEEIERQIEEDWRMARKEIKLLLVGAEDFGKSGFLRNMQSLRHGAYTDDEKSACRGTIVSTVIGIMRATLGALPELNLSLQPSNERFALTLAKARGGMECMNQDVSTAIRRLWRHDPAIQTAVREHCTEFDLHESAVYFLNAIDRISAPDYLPLDEDISRCNITTTGITETTFKASELTYKIIDVGGQRNETRKWIHCFEDITALLFVISLDAYDEALPKDTTRSCLEEALHRFESICNSQWLSDTPVILVLDSIDIFAEKLPESPLENYFPDFTGGGLDAATDYLKNRFVSLNQSPDSRQIYPYLAYSTDNLQLQFIISTVQGIILERCVPDQKQLE
ncbi:heterotrimeric G protein alpha subunit B [Coprinopsis sp. MPI-PUGE-AT-0042]|nr:heterotrimeric G protein alpha subunit B [Coprinopsis sp. MPI-PUGE-AT-0042]